MSENGAPVVISLATSTTPVTLPTPSGGTVTVNMDLTEVQEVMDGLRAKHKLFEDPLPKGAWWAYLAETGAWLKERYPEASEAFTKGVVDILNTQLLVAYRALKKKLNAPLLTAQD